MTDKEKLFKLRTDESFFTKIYNEHKGHTMRFLYRMNNDSDLLSDIYQDAMIVLYQKVKDPAFNLTCSIQTYINSICRNQLLNIIKKNSKVIAISDDFDSGITDWFEDEFSTEKENRINCIEKVLEQVKSNGGNCYEILKSFFFDKKSQGQTAEILGYNNGKTVKNIQSRCLKTVKQLSNECYGSI